MNTLSFSAIRIAMLSVIIALLGLSLGCQVPFAPQPTGPAPLEAVKVAYLNGSELWTMNWDGSEPIQVAAGLQFQSFGCKPYYISPNGHLVAYQTTDGQVWMAETRGSTHQQVAQGAAKAVSWFPDSRGLIYNLGDDIYVHPLDEAMGPQVVAGGAGRLFVPTWSYDSRHIALLETSGGGAFNVILLKVESASAEGVHQRALGATAPSSRGGAGVCPDIVAWSPDSTKVLVDYGQPVFIFYVAGGTPTQVSSSEDGLSHCWSPNSQSIAFKERDGSLWLVNADGSGQRPLVAEAIGQLRWSPAGMNVAYTTGGSPSDLWLVNAADSSRVQLTAGDSYHELSPLWTPDGGRIVFRRTGPAGEEAGLWSVAVDGSDLRQLSAAGNIAEVFALR